MKAEDRQYESGEFDIEIKKYEKVWDTWPVKYHYTFEVVVKKKEENNTFQVVGTYKRRYSDFEDLHKDLEKFNPGCKIPDIPEKNIQANIGFTNEELIVKRMEDLDMYLKYLIRHKHLKKNSAFNLFLSNDWERYKSDKQSPTYYEKIYYYLPNILKNKNPPKYNDNDVEKDRENISRLDSGISEMNNAIEKYIKINEERTEIIKNISDLASKLEDLPMNLNDNNIKKDEEKKEKEIDKKNSEILKKLHEKSVQYTPKLKEEVKEPLSNFINEVKCIKDIFSRKDKFLSDHEELKNNTRKDENMSKQLSIQEEVKGKINEQLKDEINDFKEKKENELLDILKSFIKIKQKTAEEFSSVFDPNLNK